MTDVSTNITIISFYINGLDIPIKGQKLHCIQETHFKFNTAD